MLNALHDEESESLEEYGSETAVLLGVLTDRLYDSQNASRALNEIEIMDIADAFWGSTISSDWMSGLLVMCSTGAWDKDPRYVAQFACMATIDSYEFRSVGRPGTYRMAFGTGAGAYGCVVTESRKAYVKLLIRYLFLLHQLVFKAIKYLVTIKKLAANYAFCDLSQHLICEEHDLVNSGVYHINLGN